MLNVMSSVLMREKIKLVLEDHCVNIFSDSRKSSKEVTRFVSLQFMLLSSAKSLHLAGKGKILLILFITTRKRVTLRTEP